MMKISFTQIVTLIALILSAQIVIAFENETLQVLKPGIDSSNQSGNDLFMPRLGNIPITETTVLPEGYTLNKDGSLAMPDDVRLEKNGAITLPDNEYPESYTVEPDGSVTAPKGVKLESKNKVVPEKAKTEPLVETRQEVPTGKSGIRSIESILGGLEEQYKTENQPGKTRPAVGEKPTDKLDKNGKTAKGQGEKEGDKANKGKKGAREKDRKEKSKGKPGTLTIPKDAAKTGDLAFLAGCWQTNMHKTSVRNGRDVYERFCFDRRGRGQIYVHESRGVFRGAASAQMEGSSLKIRSGRAYKAGIDGYYYSSLFICDGYESNTRCRERSENDHYWQLILTRVE